MDYTRQLVISLLCLGAVVGDEDFSLTDCCKLIWQSSKDVSFQMYAVLLNPLAFAWLVGRFILRFCLFAGFLVFGVFCCWGFFFVCFCVVVFWGVFGWGFFLGGGVWL